MAEKKWVVNAEKKKLEFTLYLTILRIASLYRFLYESPFLAQDKKKVRIAITFFNFVMP